MLTLVLGAFIRLQFDASIMNMVPEDDPVLTELLEVTEDFGSQELFAVALRADNVYTPEVLRKIDSLAATIAALPGVSSVETPLNIQYIDSGFFGIDIRPITESVPQTVEEIAAFRTAFETTPYAGRLITADGTGAMLLVQFEPWEDEEKQKVVDQIEDIVRGLQGPEEFLCCRRPVRL